MVSGFRRGSVCNFIIFVCVFLKVLEGCLRNRLLFRFLRKGIGYFGESVGRFVFDFVFLFFKCLKVSFKNGVFSGVGFMSFFYEVLGCL